MLVLRGPKKVSTYIFLFGSKAGSCKASYLEPNSYWSFGAKIVKSNLQYAFKKKYFMNYYEYLGHFSWSFYMITFSQWQKQIFKSFFTTLCPPPFLKIVYYVVPSSNSVFFYHDYFFKCHPFQFLYGLVIVSLMIVLPKL